MSSFIKNSLFVLSLCFVVPAHTESEKSQLLEFINNETVAQGILGSILSYKLLCFMTNSTFDAYHKIGMQQEKDALQQNASDEAKRIGEAIREIKLTLKTNKGKEPLFVACSSNFPGLIATIKQANNYGIILGGGSPDLLFGLRANSQKASKKARECLINHEYSHFKHNDVQKRNIFASMQPLLITLTWRAMRYSGNNKMTAGTASIITALIHSYLGGKLSQMHETRADLEASQDPEVLKAGATWFKDTWHPFEVEESKKNIHNLCKNLNLSCIEGTVANFLQWFRTHPTNDQRAKDFIKHAAQLSSKKLEKKQTL